MVLQYVVVLQKKGLPQSRFLSLTQQEDEDGQTEEEEDDLRVQ